MASALACLCQIIQTAAAAEIPTGTSRDTGSKVSITLEDHGHHVEVTDKGGGLYHIRTLGNDPYISAKFLAEPIDPLTQHILAFEYTADTNPELLQVFYGPPISAAAQAAAPMAVAADWTEFRIDLKETGKNFRGPIILFRLDFGLRANVNFRIRNVRLLGPGPGKKNLVPGPSERLVTVEVDTVVIDFAEAFDAATSENSLSTKQIKSLTIDKIDGRGIFQHSPGDVSNGNARITYADVLMPTISGDEKLILSYHKGLNVDHTTRDQADGVGFVVAVDGKEVHRSLKQTKDWEKMACDLSEFAGRTVTVSLEMDGLGNSNYDQATWGHPRIIVEGRRQTKQVIEKVFGIRLSGVKPARAAATTLHAKTDEAVTLVSSFYRHLNLDAMIQGAASTPHARPLVPYGPRLVAGEGPHPDNHTIVRILGRHQLPVAQFLAFPADVRGGVGVECGRFGRPDELRIVAYPLAGKTRALRVFDEHGGLQNEIGVNEAVSPPFSVCAGDFLSTRPGDEIAVASARQKEQDMTVLFYGGKGELLETRTRRRRGKGKTSVHLSCKPDGQRDAVMFYDETSRTSCVVDTSRRDQNSLHLAGLPSGSRIFPSAYADRDLNVVRDGSVESWLTAHGKGKQVRINAGSEENIFWYYLQKSHAGDKAQWQELPDARYIRNGKYNFLGGVANWSEVLKSGELEGHSYADWTGGRFAKAMLKRLAEYDQGRPKTWSPIVSHRWGIAAMWPTMNIKDTTYGLPKYMLLDRDNETIKSGHFGHVSFSYGSYNFEMPGLDDFYTYCQREFLRRLAPLHRANPEHLLAVEPNHENEIVSGEGGSTSIGDYNTSTIEGFYKYLLVMYSDLAGINSAFSSAFGSDFFDAPRDRDRGAWDSYDVANPYFVKWLEYNTTLVHRRVGNTFREALLAGFPPEAIKCHQIPDSYVFGFEIGFSAKTRRITPIDWMLNAGTGFGFTRYGTWYKKKHNCAQGSHSSGFDSVLIGEYGSLTPNEEDAYRQLVYMQEHGINFLHVMWWPSSHDRGYNKAQIAALKRFAAENDVPKPGLAGGIREVRPYRRDGMAYDIASLGTGSEHTGLLKSLKADGKWEGTVYTVPFHAHVDITQVADSDATTVNQTEAELCKVDDIYSGMQLEIVFTGRSTEPTSLVVKAYHAGHHLRDQDMAVELSPKERHYRLIKTFSIPIAELSFRLQTGRGEAELTDLEALEHRERTVRLKQNVLEGKRHSGGITFDVLE
ncbi:MAG: hypothetical protein HN742_04605 [Lentisphaerae bacterium]|nr:hypothetical protein [Lentisphaerota bacterium]MBT4822883.1 hypothetical protein [Lentisphaerota bacterium]MBT5612641.1 hypothetical protein [Lentisphaerota bacterium]MBT7053665.1 hypothetical protein [Lentisphaerota bacterium]MBT7841126.1 hypothetical protein [Lentisphaerota bacterium]